MLNNKKAITQTNIDLSSKVFCDIHLRAISQEVPINQIHNMCSKIPLLKALSHLPGANTLTHLSLDYRFSADNKFKNIFLNWPVYFS